MIKAYGYLRVSGTGQVDGDGFDRQRELISSFADQAGIVIPRFYEERGISGAKGEEDRPAFQEMLTAILFNGVRAVIVERLDRGECTVGELTELDGLDQTTVSKHLLVLRSHGIVEDQRRGSNVFYKLLCPCVVNFFSCATQVLKERK